MFECSLTNFVFSRELEHAIAAADDRRNCQHEFAVGNYEGAPLVELLLYSSPHFFTNRHPFSFTDELRFPNFRALQNLSRLEIILSSSVHALSTCFISPHVSQSRKFNVRVHFYSRINCCSFVPSGMNRFPTILSLVRCQA